MHVHILGICGTFMGSLAVLARQLGHRVSGSDAGVYPPMSTQLERQGIELREGFLPEHLEPAPDLVIIGNVLSRANPAVEYVLNKGINYISGPQWLAQFVLRGRWVLGVAGTHGKTTTSAMLTWILERAGMKPGYLIGGVAGNFPQSASLGDSPLFVVEADEYDSAFFDKRSKFIHYAPRTAVLNNLEFDHADIFDNLAAIEKQFHHLVRTVPGNGLIVHRHGDAAVETVLGMGCWTPRQQFGVDLAEGVCREQAANGGAFWNARLANQQCSDFEIVHYQDGAGSQARVEWQLTGVHNVANALAAVAAAAHAGVTLDTAAAALRDFQGVKRRLELRGEPAGVKVYDDFAHHPTAIELTLSGMAARLRAEGSGARLIAVVEPGSNTMKMGVHQQTLGAACQAADRVVWFKPADSSIDFKHLLGQATIPANAFDDVADIVGFLVGHCRPGDNVVIMSNGSFGGIHEKLLRALGQR